GVGDTPAPPAVVTIHRFDIGEYSLQCIGHALCRAMRNAEFLADLIEADARPPRGSQTRQPDQVLSLAERHDPNPGHRLCQILTPTHAMAERAICRDASLVGDCFRRGGNNANY